MTCLFQLLPSRSFEGTECIGLLVILHFHNRQLTITPRNVFLKHRSACTHRFEKKRRRTAQRKALTFTYESNFSMGNPLARVYPGDVCHVHLEMHLSPSS